MSQDALTPSLPGLSRRSLIKSLALGTGLMTANGLTALALAAPDKTIVWGKMLEATMYDPATSILASSWELLHVVYDGLTQLDADLKPVPALAESWTTPSATHYVFKLRKGVKFSNGREMSAEDVVGSLKRLIDPKTGSFFAAQMGQVKAITAEGGNVNVELAEPYAPFLTALASTMASILPMKELAAGSFDPSKTLMGTGPFMVSAHAQGDRWTLVKNPHYWQAGLPKFDSLVVRIVPNDQAMIAGLRDGNIDIAQFDASPDAKLQLKSVANVQVVQNPQSNMFWMMLNGVAKTSPFANAQVRQAVALALDRDMIANVGMGGNGLPAAAIAPIFNAVDTSKLGVFARNVPRAKALLKEAGVSNLSFELLMGADAAWLSIGQVIKNNLAEAGITANLAALDEGTYVKRVWIDNPGNFQAALGWYAGYSDPAMLPLWFVPKAAGFTGGYQVEDATLIKAIEELRAMTGNEKNRSAAIQSVCDQIHTQANQIPLITRVETMAYRKDRIKADGIEHKDGYADNLHHVASYTKL